MTIRHAATHTDAYGDRIQIKAAQGELHGQPHLTIEPETDKILVFTPDQARQIAADLIQAADDTEASATKPAASNDPWESAPALPQDSAPRLTSVKAECHDRDCGLADSALVHVDH